MSQSLKPILRSMLAIVAFASLATLGMLAGAFVSQSPTSMTAQAEEEEEYCPSDICHIQENNLGCGYAPESGSGCDLYGDGCATYECEH